MCKACPQGRSALRRVKEELGILLAFAVVVRSGELLRGFFFTRRFVHRCLCKHNGQMPERARGARRTAGLSCEGSSPRSQKRRASLVRSPSFLQVLKYECTLPLLPLFGVFYVQVFPSSLEVWWRRSFLPRDPAFSLVQHVGSTSPSLQMPPSHVASRDELMLLYSSVIISVP